VAEDTVPARGAGILFIPDSLPVVEDCGTEDLLEELLSAMTVPITDETAGISGWGCRFQIESPHV